MLKQNQQVVETRDRGIAKGMVVAMTCEIVRLDNEKETYKVQSDTKLEKYYIVKFMDGTPVFCSCKDFELQIKKGNERHICKHQRGIVFAKNYGLIVVGTKQQQNSKSLNMEPSYSTTSSTTTSSSNIKKQESTSYKDDDYTF